MIARPTYRVLGLLLLAGTWGACDAAVDPFSEGSERTVALHGYLDTAADSQYVRVQTLRRTIDGPRPGLEGLAVRSIADGDTVSWQPFTTTDGEGRPAYGFRAAFRPTPGRPVEVVAYRNGAVAARAETDVPAVPGASKGIGLGDTFYYSVPARLLGVASGLRRFDVWYDVIDPASGDTVRLTIAYGKPGEVQGADWEFTVYLVRDRIELQRRLGVTDNADPLLLVRTGARVDLLSPEWSDPDGDPGIVQGHGFFASIGRYDVPWRLSPRDIDLGGFKDGQ